MPDEWLPGAVHDLVAGRSRRDNDPVRLIIHMAVTHSDDIYGPGKGPGGTYAHLYNPKNGAMRQHQLIGDKAYASLDANGESVSVEHEGWPGDDMTDGQVERNAQLFAFLVNEWDVPNRIATVDDTRGLAGHRLGINGNFGSYDADDITTWTGDQSGADWSGDFGKTCPTNAYLRRFYEIYALSQDYISGDKKVDVSAGGGRPAGGHVKPSKPKPKKKPYDKRDSKSGDRHEWWWHKLRVDGDFGPITKRAYQRLLDPAKVGGYNGIIDGRFGDLSVKAEQRWLDGLGYYAGRIDGWRGPMTISALQAFLYDKGLYRRGSYSKAVMVDGDFGKRSVKALQKYANKQRRYYR